MKERGFNNPDLGNGLAYMVDNVSYEKYLKSNTGAPEMVSYWPSVLWPIVDVQQISTCGSDLHAVNQAYTKYSQGYAATGVAAVSCRHAFVRPNGVVNLQKGER